MATLTGPMNLVNHARPDLHRYWVNGTVWAALDARGKEKVSLVMAVYSGWKSGSGSNWAEVYDARSGRLLATYSETRGFAVR